MLSFTKFLREQNLTIEELIQSYEVLSIIESIDEEVELTEASFQINGKTYKTAWGKYSCDGKSITRDEYIQASEAYKNSKKVGYKEKTRQDIKNAASDKLSKHLANNNVNMNNIISKYKNYDWDSIDDYNVKQEMKTYANNFIKHAGNASVYARKIKMLKIYVETPEKLTSEQKKKIEHDLKNVPGTKNREKSLLNFYLDGYKESKKRAENNLSNLTNHENALKHNKRK